MALKLRRGTEADRLVYTPEEGELVYTTDAKKVWVGDGVTVGGNPVTTTGAGGEFGMLNLIDDTTPQLGGNLDLNNFSIIGVGEINIDGNIYATGNINLGNDPADVINVGGLITGSLIPTNNGAYTLGTLSNKWGGIFTDGIDVVGEAALSSVTLTGSIKNSDSSVFYDQATSILSANIVYANLVNADVVGNILHDDSTVLVDGTSKKISNGILTLSGNSLTVNDLQLFFGEAEFPISETQVFTNSFTVSKADVSNDLTAMPSISVEGSRGTLDTPLAVTNGDFIGQFAFTSYDGVDYTPKAFLIAEIDTAGTNPLPGKLNVVLHDADGNYTSKVNIDSKHVLTAQTTRHTPYADAAARDADITAPQAGMIVFLTDGDGAGNPKFQGYTGSGWVALN